MRNRIQECVILYSFVLFCVFQQIIRKKLKYKLFFTSLYIKLLILQIKDSSPIGRSDFCEKKLDTFHVVPSCYRTPIPKFYVLWNVAFWLVAGPLKMLTVIQNQKWAKKCIFTFLKPVPGGNVFFGFLTFFKAKKEETPKLFFYLFFLGPSQKPFYPFWGPKLECLNIFDIIFYPIVGA